MIRLAPLLREPENHARIVTTQPVPSRSFESVWQRVKQVHFGRGLRKDEKLTLLLDDLRRDPAGYDRLRAALEEQP